MEKIVWKSFFEEQGFFEPFEEDFSLKSSYRKVGKYILEENERIKSSYLPSVKINSC